MEYRWNAESRNEVFWSLVSEPLSPTQSHLMQPGSEPGLLLSGSRLSHGPFQTVLCFSLHVSVRFAVPFAFFLPSPHFFFLRFLHKLLNSFQFQTLLNYNNTNVTFSRQYQITKNSNVKCVVNLAIWTAPEMATNGRNTPRHHLALFSVLHTALCIFCTCASQVFKTHCKVEFYLYRFQPR